MHKEENCFISRLGMSVTEYNLDKIQPVLLDYLKSNALLFSSPLNLDDRPSMWKSWGFHKDGISIGLEVTLYRYLPRDIRLHYLDLKLVSAVTPTQGLEDELTKIVAPFKR